MLIQSLIVGAALLGAQTSLTQTTPIPASAGTAPTEAARPPLSRAAATVSDTEVEQYASAESSIRNIRADKTGSDADRNRRAANVIKATGLTSARFDQITQAMQANPALAKRIHAITGDETPTP
ncbi:DUF4168 domain-containing protein [Sphingomonas sp. S2-65]|uniref:DUF4168 domain-containing protein n=1 Tax=Sphingomonas sp. S2-65 TaxID=2903960 RepID=UPI001F43550C|nr:DUF4168 domain-containing protein [Sphingomonas sp. S2-65]UYY57747.1 DUF4168 domain-containing protein [Sphingomonas sp. S2-65]